MAPNVGSDLVEWLPSTKTKSISLLTIVITQTKAALFWICPIWIRRQGSVEDRLISSSLLVNPISLRNVITCNQNVVVPWQLVNGTSKELLFVRIVVLICFLCRSITTRSCHDRGCNRRPGTSPWAITSHTQRPSWYGNEGGTWGWGDFDEWIMDTDTVADWTSLRHYRTIHNFGGSKLWWSGSHR